MKERMRKAFDVQGEMVLRDRIANVEEQIRDLRVDVHELSGINQTCRNLIGREKKEILSLFEEKLIDVR